MRPPIEEIKARIAELRALRSIPRMTDEETDRLFEYIEDLEDALVRFSSGDPIHTGEWEALGKMAAQIPKEEE